MGTAGYMHAQGIQYRTGEVILEVGSGESTHWLAQVGPKVFSLDIVAPIQPLPAVLYWMGPAESALVGWTAPIGFAWLDGWDFPYTGVDYPEQAAAYAARGQEFSQEASMRSHLAIAQRITGLARVIAFDDTWRTHEFEPEMPFEWCNQTVPPATAPAPALAMDQPEAPRTFCGLDWDHPHHVDPDRGWAGKGGTAIPWLLDHGYTCIEYGLGLVVLEKENM